MKRKLILVNWVERLKTGLDPANPIQSLIIPFNPLRTSFPLKKNVWPLVLGFVCSLCLVLVFGWRHTPAVAQISQATVVEILDGNQVFIQNQPAQVNAVASLGQTVSTRRSRANLVFNNNAGVRLGQNSALTVGSRCVQLRSGRTVVSGAQGCVGSVTAVTRGTIYLMELDEMGRAQIKVLEGEVEVSERFNNLDSEIVQLSQGQKVDISPEGILGTIAQLSEDEIQEIVSGVLFRGFNTELPGINKLKDVLNNQFPKIELPDVLQRGIPSVPNLF